MKERGRQGRNYLLLQINDALFPIGGYSHSYGLETYIQKGVVRDEKTAEEYIRSMLLYSVCQNELMAAAQAYDAAEAAVNEAGQTDAGTAEAVAALRRLDECLTATRAAMEVRQAAEKLGSRFIKTVSSWEVPFESGVFSLYTASPGPKNHPVVYGAFCACAGIGRRQTLEHYLYAQTSAMVTNCVKTVPLSQTVGQRLLYRCQPVFEEVLERLAGLEPEELGAEAPGFEIRCMQHEGLYSRLYMS